jgi:dolichyl-phosphate-mannose--protein O-mannosyl transferase
VLKSIFCTMHDDRCLFVDTGLLTLSQYILLDPFMLFFITASALCYVQFVDASDRLVN